MWLLSRQTVVAPFIVCLCMLGIVLFQFPKLQKLLYNQQTTSSEIIEKDLKAEKLRLSLLKRMPAFGYDNLIANWAYLNFLQYFGDDEIRAKTGYSLSPEYFEVIIERDPRFLEAYLALSTSTSLYAAVPKRTINMIEKGLKSLSPQVQEKSYYVWRYKAIDELLFLGDSQAAQESFLMAAKWASQFSDEESKFVASTSLKTAEFLSRNPDSKYAQIATWGMILSNQVDESTRKIAISQIEELGGKVITTPEGTHRIIFPPKD